jgi:hypothetical protein
VPAEKNQGSSSAIPPELVRLGMRQVRLNANGVALVFVASCLLAAALWTGVWLNIQVRNSERRVRQFASEAVATMATVTDIRSRRGGGQRRNSRISYRYDVDGVEHKAQRDLRRHDRDKFKVGSPVPIYYLSSEPSVNWVEGFRPRRRPAWPIVLVPAGLVLGAATIAVAIRRQMRLLAEGRGALATVTKTEKFNTQHGSRWRVHYEWRVLSGGRRVGRYTSSAKAPPAIGSRFPIVYDRDDATKHARYPPLLVRVLNAR